MGQSAEEQITAIAETVVALEEPAPYTKSEMKSFYRASKFLQEWGTIAFQAPDEVLEADGIDRESAIESAQPILAVSLELIRMAAGAPPTVERELLQERVRELGQMAIMGFAQAQAQAMGIDVDLNPMKEPDEPDGRAFY